MSRYSIYARDGASSYYEKKFGSGAPFGSSNSGIWYPSYLGIDIFFTQLSENILGMTNGKRILLKDGMGSDISEFVLMHEEEHVKDMSADEATTDARALRRLFAKNKEISSGASELLKKRWGAAADSLFAELYGKL